MSKYTMSKDTIKSVCVPLDPDDVGSMISGYVNFPEIKEYEHNKTQHLNYSANLALSDCSRVINWNFIESDGLGFNIEKIDNVIGVLMTFRQYMKEADTLYKRLSKSVKEHNDLIEKNKKKNG